MGLKTIENEYKAAIQEVESTFSAFLKEAKQINTVLGRLDEINASLLSAMAERDRDLKTAEKQAQGLKTHRIVQLEEMRSLLIAACSNLNSTKPIDLREIERMADQCKLAIQFEKFARLQELTEKRVAAFPKEVEPGMTFKWRNSKAGLSFEIVKINSGGGFYEVKTLTEDGKTGSDRIPVKDLNAKEYKYIKT